MLDNSGNSDFTEGKLTALNLILITNLTSKFFNKAFVYNITSGLICSSQHKNVGSLVFPSLCVQWCIGKWNGGNLTDLEMANTFMYSGFDFHQQVWPLSWGQAMMGPYATVRAPSKTGVVLHSGVQIQSKFITDLVYNFSVISGLCLVIYMNRSNFCGKRKRERFYCVMGSHSRSTSKREQRMMASKTINCFQEICARGCGTGVCCSTTCSAHIFITQEGLLAPPV